MAPAGPSEDVPATPAPAQGGGIPIYVINRAADANRMARFTAAAEALSLSFTRIEALDGHDEAAPLFLYQNLIPQRFWGDETIKPGAFACAVSHLTAWRRMLADGAEVALIVEDDALPFADPGAVLSAACPGPGAGTTPPFDILFANPRLAAWAEAAGEEGAAAAASAAASAAAVVGGLAAAGAAPGRDGLAAAPGADAYFVSRTGAARLVEMLTATGVVAGVDWLMLAHGLASDAAPWPEIAWLDAATTGMARDLRVLISARPVTADGGGASVLNHSLTAPLSGFGAGSPTADLVAPGGMSADPVAQDWAAGRFHEAPALEMMRRWAPAGGVFVDVGAHLGNHTIFMLRHGAAARALVFEPHRKTVAALSALIERAGLADRVETAHLGFGLAEEPGRREAKGGRRSSYRLRLRRGFDEAIRVRTGDALIRKEPVDMIKIDVGGEEREVLKGLRRTINRRRPLLVIDFSAPKSAKALPLLARLGYREAERAAWREESGARIVALFRWVDEGRGGSD